MKPKKFKLANLYLMAVFFILYAPILYLVVYSFNSGGTMSNFEGFTLDWYKSLFTDTRLLVIVLNTIVIALLSATISTVLGVIGASFLILFTMLGIQLGFYSVLLAHIAFSVPIVVILVLPKLQEMSPTLIDASRDLGASTWDVLTKVILPYITPGIFAGFFTALTYSLDDFAVTFFVTGNGFTTLAVEVYSRARQGISLEINALSAILFLFTLILVLGYYVLAQRGGKAKEVRR